MDPQHFPAPGQDVPVSGTTITLEEAIHRTTEWREFFQQHFRVADDQIPRSCKIPMDDIIRLSQDPRFANQKFSGIRAYFACPRGETKENMTGITLIFVPINEEHEDQLVINDDKHSTAVFSTLEDFTKPCPRVCDTKSPLY